MAKIKKLPVEIKKEVKVTLQGNVINATGAKGTLTLKVPSEVAVEMKDGLLEFYTASTASNAKALCGLNRKLAANMIQGVSEGFRQVLDMTGVGFKSETDGKLLRLTLGFSHDIVFEIPAGVTIKCLKPTQIEITGFDKQLVGQVASNIRQLRKPEPYKGKGIRYEGEVIRRKEGKKK